MRGVERALEVIQQAIQNEIAGQRFYSDASFYCLDPWAKDLFSNLALEEEGHTQLLLVEYESLKQHGRWLDPDSARSSGAEVDITQFTFSGDASAQELFPSQWSVDQAVDRRTDDLAALAFGISMEEQAINLYGEQSQENVDPAAREAYQFLVDEERRHFRQLKDQWERLAGVPFGDA